MSNKPLIIEAIPIRDQVANIIRKRIITGELGTNQQLIERELSKEFNVSTTPIKEAFRILESEGFIYTVSRKGSYVADISTSGFTEIAYVRSAFEGMVTYIAVLKITEEDIEYMGKLLQRMEPYIETQDLKSLQLLAQKFHQTIRAACGNSFLLKALRNFEVVDEALVELHVISSNRKSLLRKNFEEHVEIYEAIKARDAELAQARMTDHKLRVTENALNATL